MHISEVEDKALEKTEVEQPQGFGLQEKTIEEMRAERDLSLLFGFDGDGFDGELGKALSVYEWAKSQTGSDEDALLAIKGVMKVNGFTERGKALLNKTYLWVSLQDEIDSNIKKQKVLRE